jgi:uncharacterized protein YaaW (UPF0174 family)
MLVRKFGGMKMAELDPVLKPQDADKILSSIQEWMIKQAANPTNPTEDIDKSEARKEAPLSPSIAPAEPSIEPSSCVPPGRPFDQSQEGKSSPVASDELFVRMGMVRTVVVVLLIAFVVGVVWHTYRDNQTRNLIKASVNWLTSSFSAAQRKSKISAQSSTELSEQAQTPIATSVQADEVAELKQQVSALMNDLAVMRRDVGQLSDKQDQMSRDIATVQATEQNVSEKISSLTYQPASTLTQPAPALIQPAPTPARPAAPAHGQARKNVPRVVHAEAPKQPDAASLAATISSTGTASLTEQPPRPPLPVPTVAEAPSPLH